MLKAYIDTGGSEEVGKFNYLQVLVNENYGDHWAVLTEHITPRLVQFLVAHFAQVILKKYKDPHIYTAVIK